MAKRHPRKSPPSPALPPSKGKGAIAAKRPKRARRTGRPTALEVSIALEREYPHAKCSLDFETPLQLLIATILSAQCTDARVNLVTKDLFARYRSAGDFAAARQPELEGIIKSTGFFRNKAKNIIACCRKLVADHGGDVPRTMEELVDLPGVARKTANVVLGNAFGIPGIAVDTHVGRLSRRLGLTGHDDPVKVELELRENLPPERWTMFSHWMIHHGRAVCDARRPRCEACALQDECPKLGVD